MDTLMLGQEFRCMEAEGPGFRALGLLAMLCRYWVWCSSSSSIIIITPLRSAFSLLYTVRFLVEEGFFWYTWVHESECGLLSRFKCCSALSARRSPSTHLKCFKQLEDMMNKEVMIQQGGISKATKTVNLSEDSARFWITGEVRVEDTVFFAAGCSWVRIEQVIVHQQQHAQCAVAPATRLV